MTWHYVTESGSLDVCCCDGEWRGYDIMLSCVNDCSDGRRQRRITLVWSRRVMCANQFWIHDTFFTCVRGKHSKADIPVQQHTHLLWDWLLMDYSGDVLWWKPAIVEKQSASARPIPISRVQADARNSTCDAISCVECAATSEADFTRTSIS